MTIDATTLSSLLLAPRPDLELRAAWDDLAAVLPEVGALDMAPTSVQHKDNVAHTIQVVAQCPARLRVRLTALLHDVGKPATRHVEAGIVTFYHHEAVGARLVVPALTRLGYGADLSDEVAQLVRLSGATKGSLGWSDAAVRRFAREAGPLLGDLLDFAAADVTSRHAHKRQAVADEVAQLRRRIAAVARADAAASWRPVVDGGAIMARYGLTPGPRVGELLAALGSAQRAAEANAQEFDAAAAWRVLDPLVR